MKQLIYRSQPFGFDQAMLTGILSQARLNNCRDDITGALICRHDLYLQLIEGPAPAIEALYARIAVDDRHCDVRLLLTDEVAERMFAEWAILHEEPACMAWSPSEVAADVLDAAGPAELRSAFQRLTRPAIG